VNIPVLYEDDWLLVADKPSGLLVIPTPKREKRTLTSILNEDLKLKGLAYRLHPCHRLDRQTSGIIVYAKGKSAQHKMMEEFKGKRVKKKYIAFLQGKVREDEGKISMPIEGESALTRFKVLQRQDNFSVVEAQPITGRTNQLRIHFKNIGHPILGEEKFAFRKDFSLRAKRLCLQAKEIEFTHPITKKNITIRIDLADYLKEFLTKHGDG
jgi:23S rRNA pseudouridine1911/1915/1917 synthase